jgi:LuxR family maltose regulon positive regulatory protein
VAPDTGCGGYRYRRPLGDFLQHEAELVLAGELRTLHQRAAHWYGEHDQLCQALDQAAVAQDWPYLAGLVLRWAPQVVGEHRDALLAAIDRLPAIAAFTEPDIAAALALGRAARGDGRGADAYLALIPAGGPADREMPLLATARLCAVLLARRGEVVAAMHTAATDLAASLDHAIPGLRPDPAQLRAIALECRGSAWLWAGALDEAERSLKAAAVAAEHHRLGPVAADCYGGLALSYLVRGDLTEAVEAARLGQGTGLGRLVVTIAADLQGSTVDFEDDGVEPRPLTAAAVAAARVRVLCRRGDPSAARAVLAMTATGGVPMRAAKLLRGLVALAEAELHLAESRPVNALTVLSASLSGSEHPLAGQARILAARAYLASAAPARAASLLAAVHQSRSAGRAEQAEAWVIDALAADGLGHAGAVGIALAEALTAAGPAGLVGAFRGAGPALGPLLARHRDLLAEYQPFAEQVEAAVRPRTVVNDRTMVEPITGRETVVLRYLPTLLTMRDIAEELSVSPNTVKSHLRSIYRKLAVGTRRDAVHRARQLGLLRQ